MDSLHANQIVHLLETAPPGRGMRKEVPGVRLTQLRNNAGIPLTGATSPSIGITSAELVATFATGTTVGIVNFKVPRNFGQVQISNQLSRELILEVQAAMAGATDSPSLTCTFTARAPDGTLRATYTAAPIEPATGAAANTHTVSGTAHKTYAFNLANALNDTGTAQRIRPGDTVTATLTFGTHSTDAIVVSNVSAFYRANTSFTNKEARYSPRAIEQDA
jgi:hypothetical protein